MALEPPDTPYYVTWEEIDELVLTLARMLAKDRNWWNTPVYMVPASGLIVGGLLAEKLALPRGNLISAPIVPAPPALIVDDVCETGDTLKRYAGLRTAVLVTYEGSGFTPDYAALQVPLGADFRMPWRKNGQDLETPPPQTYDPRKTTVLLDFDGVVNRIDRRVFQALARDHNIVVLSGRLPSDRTPTQGLLAEAGIPWCRMILCGDQAEKVHEARKLIDEGFVVTLAFEDDPEVARAFREAGIVVAEVSCR